MKVQDSCPCGATVTLQHEWALAVNRSHDEWLAAHAACREQAPVVARLDVGPDDIIALRVPEGTALDRATEQAARLRAVFPGRTVVVLLGGMSIGAVATGDPG